MSTSRLRNRKTGDEFEVLSNGIIPVKLSQKSVFSESSTSRNVELMESFIQDIAKFLPETTSDAIKQKTLSTLRQELMSREKEVNNIINAPEKIASLLTECVKQSHTKSTTNDKTSFFSFLSSLGTEIVKAKMNSVFPGLALLAGLATPAAAKSVLRYFPGKPEGGEDMCAALENCIQGYLADITTGWTKDMPQIARVITDPSNNFLYSNSYLASCLTQDDLKTFITNAYDNSAKKEICEVGRGALIANNVNCFMLDKEWKKERKLLENCPWSVAKRHPLTTSAVLVGFALLAIRVYIDVKNSRQALLGQQQPEAAPINRDIRRNFPRLN